MIILGIETSCDETAAAVVEKGTKILSNVVASSVEFHQKTGGIIPEVAAREQLKCIIPVINVAVESSKIRLKNLDAIAITVGPGLIGSLLVGVETARTLAFVTQIPLVPVNHLQAHLYANFLEGKIPQFPAIGLVVSGGHTDLVLIDDHKHFSWLGGTRDDAAGECFDKTARVLGLPYPGGPAISAEAAKWKAEKDELKIKLPRPMISEENFDFSFSGLKTAVINQVREQERRREKVNVSEMAFEIQEAIADVLLEKTFRASQKYKVKSVLLAGGVAANNRLREKFEQKFSNFNIQLFIPSVKLCTDNATYVASFAHYHFHPVSWKEIQARAQLTIDGK